MHGILVQLPLPKHIDATLILDAIHPTKDVDAFHPENVGLMLQGRPRFLPCTPAGVMRLLEVSAVPTSGQHAVVIGRSDIVGKPMAALLLQKGVDATVTVCHSRTKDIAEVCRSADIIVAALGIPEFLRGSMIKPGAVVIDVGINRVGERLVGDVHYEEASAVAICDYSSARWSWSDDNRDAAWQYSESRLNPRTARDSRRVRACRVRQ